MVLVGNKIDLDSERAVSYEDGEEFAKMNNMPFFETSAKTGVNIENIFVKSAEMIAQKINDGYYDTTSDACGIKVGINDTTPMSGLSNNVVANNNRRGKCCK